jgi:hypothetical protein
MYKNIQNFRHMFGIRHYHFRKGIFYTVSGVGGGQAVLWPYFWYFHVAMSSYIEQCRMKLSFVSSLYWCIKFCVGTDYSYSLCCCFCRVKQDHLVPQVYQDVLVLEAYQVHEVTKVRLGRWDSQVNLVEMVTEDFLGQLQPKVCICYIYGSSGLENWEYCHRGSVVLTMRHTPLSA